MNIFFFIFHGFSDVSGISKKIQYQIKGLRQGGHKVDVCQYTITNSGHRIRMVNDDIIQDYGIGKIAAIKKRIDYKGIIDYINKSRYDIVYIRSFHNANPFTINLFSNIHNAGAKIAFEIPTYPYDKEYEGFPINNKIELFFDKIFRRKLTSYVDAIVTFTNDEFIFGKRTIKISNGIDFDSIPLQHKKCGIDNVINLVGVAEVHYWHGYDRLIAGLGQYYNQKHSKDVYFHIVGGVGDSEMYNSIHAHGFENIISKYNIRDKVIFHGAQYGESLNDILDIADCAIGSLGRHRCGISNLKSLKNREYAARGIPFIYSEIDTDFDNRNYVFKIPADESYIDIKSILSFLYNNNFSSLDIRNSILNLSWKNQMAKVIDNLV